MNYLKTALKTLHDGDAPLLAAMPGWFFIDIPASPGRAYGVVKPITGDMVYSSVNRMEEIPVQIEINARTLTKLTTAAEALYAVFDDGVLSYTGGYIHNSMRRTGFTLPQEANKKWKLTVDYLVERSKPR